MMIGAKYRLMGSAAFLAMTAWSLPAAAQDVGQVADQRSVPVPEGALAGGSLGAQPEAIVVTGSRILRDGSNAPTPVTVIGEQRLDARAATNVADVLNELPSFRPLQTPATQQAVGGNIGARVLDLRGLGATRTLVLLDGKRFVPSTQQGTVDINLIPTALVQRVEIVTGGASAAYGSDAVAGVVNFILDRNLTGLKATAQYGFSQQNDNHEQYASLAYGTPFAGGRGHVLVAGEYANSEGLGDCYTRDWCPQEMLVGNSPAGFGGFPASIRTGPNQTASLSAGGLINSGPLLGTAFGTDGGLYPYRYGTIYGASPSPLFAVGGEGALANGFLTGTLLIPPVERYTAYTRASYDLTDTITAAIDLSYGQVNGEVLGSAPRGNFTIRRDNAFLPAELGARMDANGLTTVSLGRAFTDIGNPIDRSENKTYRAVASLEGRLLGTWNWDVYYQFGRNDFRQDYTNNTVPARLQLAVDAVNTPGGPACRVNADGVAGNDVPECVPFNVFGSGNASDAAVAYVAQSGFQTAETDQHVVAANVSGSLITLPGGDLQAAAGAEYRSDEMTGDADALSSANAFWSFNGKAIDGRIQVTEGYLEAVAPVLGDMPGVRLLELNGAVRQTHYERSSPVTDSTTVDVTTWKVGAVYEPFSWLRLRGTRSRDIRAPNLTELFGPVSAGRTTIVDPANQGQQIQITALSGANPDLVPEKADTWTVGAVLTPYVSFGSRLSFSVDYFDIELAEAIGSLGAQTIVENCYNGATEYCDFVSRDASNQLTQVENVLLNIAEQRTRGIDFELSYATKPGPLGSFDFRGLATRYLELSTGGIDRVGQTGFRPGTTTGVPDWTVDGFLNWNRGPVTMGLHGRYISEGIFDVGFVGPEDEGFDVDLPNSIDTNRVDDALLFDINMAFDVTDEVEVFAVVNNVFNSDPPLAASAQGGTNQVYFDPIGRYFRLGARVRLP